MSEPMRTTTVKTVPVDRLSAEELDSWHRLRASNSKLDSP